MPYYEGLVAIADNRDLAEDHQHPHQPQQLASWMLLFRPDFSTTANGYNCVEWTGANHIIGGIIQTACCGHRIDNYKWLDSHGCMFCGEKCPPEPVCTTDEPSCPLCLHSREGGEDIVQLSCCGQTVGLSCFREWTHGDLCKGKCPFCRAALLQKHECGIPERISAFEPDQPVITSQTPIAIKMPRPAVPRSVASTYARRAAQTAQAQYRTGAAEVARQFERQHAELLQLAQRPLPSSLPSVSAEQQSEQLRLSFAEQHRMESIADAWLAAPDSYSSFPQLPEVQQSLAEQTFQQFERLHTRLDSPPRPLMERLREAFDESRPGFPDLSGIPPPSSFGPRNPHEQGQSVFPEVSPPTDFILEPPELDESRSE